MDWNADHCIENEGTAEAPNSNNNISAEQYLHRLFRDQCEFKVAAEEVSEVQSFVESSIHALLETLVYSQEYTEVLDQHRRDRKGIHFYVQDYDKARLLKVGSFYEGTKNQGPDEFDFIFLVGECDVMEYENAKKQLFNISDRLHQVIEDSIDQGNSDVTATLSYKGLHGPASKLELKQTGSGRNDDRIISVDISFACRVKLKKITDIKLFKVNFGGWKNVIEETGSVLLLKIYKHGHPKHKTSVQATITEAEQLYMKSFMSEKHKKVYRLLKVLINGNDYNEEVKRLVREPTNRKTIWVNVYTKARGPVVVCDFPSYAIKNLVFAHAQSCRSECCSVSDCTVQILINILQTFQKEINRCSTFHNFKTFSVRVEKIVGDSLEIADDYESSVDIAETLVEIIESIRCGQKTEQEGSQLVLTGQAVDLVKAVLQKQREGFKGNTLSILNWIVFSSIFFLAIPFIYSQGQKVVDCSQAKNKLFDPVELMTYTLECSRQSGETPETPCACLPLSLNPALNVPDKLELSCIFLPILYAGKEDFSILPEVDVLVCPSKILTTVVLEGCYIQSRSRINTDIMTKDRLCQALECPPNISLIMNKTNEETYSAVDLCCVVTGSYTHDQVMKCLASDIFASQTWTGFHIWNICWSILVGVVPIRFLLYKRKQLKRLKTVRQKIAIALDTLRNDVHRE